MVKGRSGFTAGSSARVAHCLLGMQIKHENLLAYVTYAFRTRQMCEFQNKDNTILFDERLFNFQKV